MTIPLDKQLHFFATAMITAWLYILTTDLFVAAVYALIIGGLKELLWDSVLKKGTLDPLDMIANSLGVIATAVVVFASKMI